MGSCPQETVTKLCCVSILVYHEKHLFFFNFFARQKGFSCKYHYFWVGFLWLGCKVPKVSFSKLRVTIRMYEAVFKSHSPLLCTETRKRVEQIFPTCSLLYPKMSFLSPFVEAARPIGRQQRLCTHTIFKSYYYVALLLF